MQNGHQLRFVVDVDDVLRNLVRNMVKLYNREFGESKKYEDVTDYDVKQSFPMVEEKYGDGLEWFFQVHGHELFYGSEIIDGALEAIDILKKHGFVQIVTKQRSLQNKVDTLFWLAEKRIEYDSVSFVNHKSVVPCDVFIDDFHENFIDCGGAVGILINAPYNKGIDLEELKKKTHFSKIIRYDTILGFAKDLDKGKTVLNQ